MRQSPIAGVLRRLAHALAIVPVLASWAVQEVGTEWTTKWRPFLDYCNTVGTLLLIAIVLHARRQELPWWPWCRPS